MIIGLHTSIAYSPVQHNICHSHTIGRPLAPRPVIAIDSLIRASSFLHGGLILLRRSLPAGGGQRAVALHRRRSLDSVVGGLERAAMAKSKNHTNHNQNYKAHRNGIKKPKRVRWISTKGVRCYPPPPPPPLQAPSSCPRSRSAGGGSDDLPNLGPGGAP